MTEMPAARAQAMSSRNLFALLQVAPFAFAWLERIAIG